MSRRSPRTSNRKREGGRQGRKGVEPKSRAKNKTENTPDERSVMQREVDERRRTEEALRKSEERYRALFETAFAGISITDPDENFVFANPTLAEMLGYSQAELVGMNLSQIAEVEEFARYQELTKQRRKGVRSYYESRVHRKDGVSLNVLISASPLTAGDGSFEGVLTVVQDITGRKRMEEALQKARD